MTGQKIIIGLLGAMILAVGGYHVVAEGPEPTATQSYPLRPAQSSALLQIPDDMSIIASDERTQACMADVDCVRDIFMKWTFGNEHEGRPPEHEDSGLQKAGGPMIVKMVGLEAASADARDGAKIGLMETIALLRSAGMSVTTSNIKRRRDAGPLGPANIIVFISDDFYRDQHGRFARVIAEDIYDGQKKYERMLKRQHKLGVLCTFALYFDTKMIINSAAIMIPSDLLKGEIRLCFHQEIIQALGPVFDFREPLLSIFTDNEKVPWFSDFDYLLTRLFFIPWSSPA